MLDGAGVDDRNAMGFLYPISQAAGRVRGAIASGSGGMDGGQERLEAATAALTEVWWPVRVRTGTEVVCRSCRVRAEFGQNIGLLGH